MKAYYVYFMTNRSRTVLYAGVTNSLVRRVTQHRQGAIEGFTQRYNVNRLVYFERFEAPRDAIAREKQIKGWRRSKKNDLVASMNPRWEDLAVTVLGIGPAPVALWREGVSFRWHSAARHSEPSPRGAESPVRPMGERGDPSAAAASG